MTARSSGPALERMVSVMQGSDPDATGDQWDAQIERDIKAGRLDELADRALQDYADGKTTPLEIPPEGT